MTLPAGSTLQNGRYVIQSVISQGEIDITYGARHTYLDQVVRIKTLQTQMRSHYEDINLREEFTRRAARFARSANPHLVRVLDGFEEDWMPFLVFKTVPGDPLAHQLRPYSLQHVLGMLRQVAPAVQNLHDQNLVHGCINLETLLVRDENPDVTPDLVLTGMGFRSFVPSLAHRLNPATHQFFTPQHDLQSLTVLLYSLLTGQRQPLEALQARSTFPELQAHHSQLPDIVQRSLNTALTQGLTPEDGESVSSWFCYVETILEKMTDKGMNQETGSATRNTFETVNIEAFPAAAGSTHTAETNPTSSPPSFEPDESPVPSSEPTQLELALVEPAHTESAHTEPAQNQAAPSASGLATTALESPTQTPPETELEPAYSETNPDDVGDSSPMTATRAASNSASNSASAQSSPSQPQRRSWKIPVALGLTSVLAALGGGYFGLSFRLQEPDQLERSPIFGREIFGSDQSFPASGNWPGESDFDNGSTRSPLFENATPAPTPYPSSAPLDRALPNPADSFTSEPRFVQPEVAPSNEPDDAIRDDLNLDAEAAPSPTRDSANDTQDTPAPLIESDRPATAPPPPQPSVAPPPPASTESTLEILVTPPQNTEAPTPAQLNEAPKPSNNSSQTQPGRTSANPAPDPVVPEDGELL